MDFGNTFVDLGNTFVDLEITFVDLENTFVDLGNTLVTLQYICENYAKKRYVCLKMNQQEK